MCWNAQISLNTFLFSSFVLGLIAYNNAYTKYKIPEFTIYMYLFAISVISMQLVEFFLWRNLKNKFYNTFFTIIAMAVLFFQPIAAFFIIQNNMSLTKTLLYTYLFIACIFTFLNIILCKWRLPYTTVSPLGHLQWKEWTITELNPLYYGSYIVWMIFFFTTFIYNAFQDISFKNIWIYIAIFAIVSLVMNMIYYFRDGTSGSMWCWFINSIAIVYASKLLIYLPFCENKSIC